MVKFLWINKKYLIMKLTETAEEMEGLPKSEKKLFSL